MDTVRSARVNVKTDFFAVGESPEDLNQATAEVMLIFNIKPLTGGVGKLRLPQELPVNTVLIAHRLHRDIDITIETIAWFRDESGKIKQKHEAVSLCAREDSASEIKRLVKVNVWRLLHSLTGNEPSPWGILRGVRPTKIVHRLIDRKLSRQAIEAVLQKNYMMSTEKAMLTTRIADYQRKWLTHDPKVSRQVSVYIGIPYCPSRCLYCSFPAYVLPQERKNIEVFLEAFNQDLSAAAQLIKKKNLAVQTLYIGGGTPTSLAANDFCNLLSFAANYLIAPSTLEFTVEAGRPDSLDGQKIQLMKQYGVTRVSVNPQSMQENTLKHIGRNHTVKDIINIFGKIRNHNFPVINMDIIAGLPGETAGDMRDTIEQILMLGPENITVHTLAVKKGSELKEHRADILLPGDQEVRNMLAIAKEKIAGSGLIPYYLYRQKYMTGQMENVGYTKPGLECIYNIQIMEERQTIIGIGPNAVTKGVDDNYNLSSVYFPKDINSYIKNIQGYIAKRNELIDKL